MKQSYFLLFLFLTLNTTGLYAGGGSKTKENGVTMTLLNYGAMMEGYDVKGYYSFYLVDKADRKNNNYQVKIYDNNFNSVNSFEIVKPNNYTLREATYNGEAFCFEFLDGKDKRQDLISFDKTGKQIKDFLYEPMDAQEYATIAATIYGKKPNENVGINAVPGKGFLKFDIEHNKKEKKTGYSITLFSNDLKKTWNLTPTLDEKHKYEGFVPMYYDDKYCVGTVMGKEKLMGMDFSYDLLVVDIQTGKKVFQASIKDTRYSVTPSGVFYDPNNQMFVMLGDYIDAQNKIAGGKSNGLAMLGFDAATGEVKTKKYLTWTKDVSKFLSIDENGQIQDGGYIAFEKMFATSDGKIFAVGEQYKKVASGMGVAAAILSGGRSAGSQSVVGIKLMDLMVFEFDQDFSIKKVSSYDKVDREIDLPATLGYYPLGTIGMFMKSWGYFDYNFMTLSSDKTTFAINYDIHSKKSNDPINLGNVIYTPEGKLIQSKIELKDKPDMYAVFPAKWGYLGIMEYNKKQKSVDTRVEKLDY